MAKYVTLDFQVRKKLGITMMEYALAERIYFLAFNKGNKFPGWCYASKQTLAGDIGYSERGIYSAVKILESKDYIERNETGWITPTDKYHKIAHCRLPEESAVPLKEFQVSPEEIAGVPPEESADNNKSNINKDLKEENNIPQVFFEKQIKTKQTKSTYYPDDSFFIEQMALKGKRSCAKIGAPWVFLTDQNYHELIEKFKHEELVKEMIKEYSGYKERKSLKARKPTLTLDDKDVAGISASWVEVNAIKVLQARNSPVIAEIRKKEKMKEKFNQK